MKPYLLPLLMSICLISACKKSGAPPAPTFTPGADVYMVGYSNGAAAYWKNGQLVLLDTSDVSEASGIVISGQDIYVCGEYNASQGSNVIELACYWKNGQRVTLTNAGISNAYGIALSGSDVYVTGVVAGNTTGVLTNNAVYWKNGVRVDLAPNSFGQAYGIAFSGEDMYVSGVVGSYGDSGVVWKNGVEQWRIISGYGSSMGAILFAGNDQYVLGGAYPSFGYWKNNDFNALTQNGGAEGMTISGSDLYMAGGINVNGYSRAGYWKNGLFVPLSVQYPPHTIDSTSNASAIAVVGTDVYVAGDVQNFLPVYWKNGVMEKLGTSGAVLAMAVGH